MENKYAIFSYISKQKLKKILKKFPGRKDIIIDNNVIKPLENIVGFSELRSLDVDKIYNLQNSNIPSQNNQQVFLISSSLISVKFVCDHINSEICKVNSKKPNYVVIVIPSKLYSVIQLMEQEGIYEFVTIYSFSWELIPIDNYILSLELPNYFNILFTNGDQTLLPATANSICSAFLIFGKPSTSVIIGEYSQLIYNMIYSNTRLNEYNKCNNDIDYFILVDRNFDYFSTLLTPSTYTGLLDEVIEICSGFVKLDSNTHTPLHSTYEVYSEITNQYFSDAISFLKTKAKVVQNEYFRSKNMKLGEIKSYVKNELHNVTNLKRSLSFHISACEQIVKKLGNCFDKFKSIEESIVNSYSKREVISLIESYLAMKLGSKFSVLRLMCLLSLVNNGLSFDIIHSLKSQFLQAYGYHYIPLFFNLEKNGLFFSNTNSSTLDVSVNTLASRLTQVMPISLIRNSSQTTIQKLKLLPNIKETDNKSSLDISYVFNKCFTPAIPQLVSLIIKNEIQVSELNKIFPNTVVKLNKNTTTPVQTFFIYFVGGVTYAEMAAFQLLKKLTGCQIIVAATNTINGNKLCKFNA